MKHINLKNFSPVNKINLDEIILSRLTPENAREDYNALMENRLSIRKQLGLSWPPDDWSYETNLSDLHRHDKEFDERISFTYGIWDESEKSYLGCLYFYLEDKDWFSAPSDSDCVIELWFIKRVFDSPESLKYINLIRNWIEKDWPFSNIYYTNIEKL